MGPATDPEQPLDAAAIRRYMASRRAQERLQHLANYRDEPPERPLLLGVRLSLAAAEARRKGSA